MLTKFTLHVINNPQNAGGGTLYCTALSVQTCFYFYVTLWLQQTCFFFWWLTLKFLCLRPTLYYAIIASSPAILYTVYTKDRLHLYFGLFWTLNSLKFCLFPQKSKKNVQDGLIKLHVLELYSFGWLVAVRYQLHKKLTYYYIIILFCLFTSIWLLCSIW